MSDTYDCAIDTDVGNVFWCGTLSIIIISNTASHCVCIRNYISEFALKEQQYRKLNNVLSLPLICTL